jgi:hypothetical protein
MNIEVSDNAAQEKLERMYKDWDKVTVQSANKCAELFADRMKEHILNGDFTLPPKKDWSWLDPRGLINTGSYLNSIKALGPGVVCDVDLRNWLEYGTRTMQSRPHWGPLLRVFAQKELVSVGEETLYELLGR